jgi:hypothetical protein
LKNAGFEVVELEANGNYFAFLAQELVRLPSVLEKYSKGKTGNNLKTRVRRYALTVVLDWLNDGISSDSGSKELLCFGYHIRAKKK